MWGPFIRGDAHQRLHLFLRLQKLSQTASADAGRLLCVLLLCRREVSARPARQGLLYQQRDEMPRIVVSLLLVVAAFAVLSLVSGASYLENMLPGGLPVGNALTAIGLCAAAGSAVGLSARRTTLRMVSVASLIGAAAWLPVSIALAGNLTLNFHGGRGGVGWPLAQSLLPLCSAPWAGRCSIQAEERERRLNKR